MLVVLPLLPLYVPAGHDSHCRPGVWVPLQGTCIAVLEAARLKRPETPQWWLPHVLQVLCASAQDAAHSF